MSSYANARVYLFNMPNVSERYQRKQSYMLIPLLKFIKLWNTTRSMANVSLYINKFRIKEYLSYSYDLTI